jgi:hypothetical protein
VPHGAKLLEARGFTRASDVPRHQQADSDIDLKPDGDLVTWQADQSVQPDGTIIGKEAGYTYFANWQITPPGATSVGLYRYQVPGDAALPGVLSPAETYTMHVAKQAGDTRTFVRLELRLPDSYKIRHTTPRDGVTQVVPNIVSYRGKLTYDTLFGAV